MFEKIGVNRVVGIIGMLVMVVAGAAMVAAGQLDASTWYLGGLGLVGSMLGIGAALKAATPQAKADEPSHD